ncbi:MAG: hypothetical protein M1823_006545, partial [Watsoniomyces obsoletus]
MITETLLLILGGGIISDASDSTAKFTNTAITLEYVNVFRKYGGKTTDISRRYPANAPGTSEQLLGTTDIASWASIGTKTLSNPGEHAP